MKPLIEPGRCSACKAPAERGRSGAWWHERGAPCGQAGARFQPADDLTGRSETSVEPADDPPRERLQHPPRNRQIPHAPEDR